MSEPKRNEWTTPGAIIGMMGLAAAAVATYSKFDGRVSVAEAQSAQLEKRLDGIDSKIDFVVRSMIESKAGK